MDALEETIIEPAKEFFGDSKRFLQRCRKPDVEEFTNSSVATLIGFLLIGAIGFFVKLIHIPINNIIVGGGR